MNTESSSIIASVVEGIQYGPSVSVKGVAFDSRLLTPGCAFVALKGHRDGHDFVEDAMKKGASVLIVEKQVPIAITQIVVPDTIEALAKWSHWHRIRSSVVVVGVTGSCGKTTFKNLLTHVLNDHAPTVATEGNLNNDIGVPITLLRIEPTHRFAVIEMGASGPGDIQKLARMAQCDLSIVTCSAPAHLDRFRSLRGVIEGKGELFRFAKNNTKAILNSDDEGYRCWDDFSRHLKCSTVGSEQPNTLQILNSTPEKDGLSMTINIHQKMYTVHSTLRGQHFTSIIALVIESARNLGVPIESILSSIETFPITQQRLATRYWQNKYTILDDSYNANPYSVRASIDFLMGLDVKNPQLVLGQMHDLGDEDEHWHQWVSEYAYQKKCPLWFFGKQTDAVLKGHPHAKIFDDFSEMRDSLLTGLTPGSTLLVKGSRAMKMERLWADETEVTC